MQQDSCTQPRAAFVLGHHLSCVGQCNLWRRWPPGHSLVMCCRCSPALYMSRHRPCTRRCSSLRLDQCSLGTTDCTGRNPCWQGSHNCSVSSRYIRGRGTIWIDHGLRRAESLRPMRQCSRKWRTCMPPRCLPSRQSRSHSSQCSLQKDMNRRPR